MLYPRAQSGAVFIRQPVIQLRDASNDMLPLAGGPGAPLVMLK
jgi:hypothetical protein